MLRLLGLPIELSVLGEVCAGILQNSRERTLHVVKLGGGLIFIIMCHSICKELLGF